MYISLNEISKYPNDRELNWTNEVQGVSHDDDYWYISQQKRLWKIPVGHDLNKDVKKNDPQLDIKSIPIPHTLSKNYDHFGDIDCFDDFLFVPLEKTDSKRTARIACFHASNLKLIGSTLVTLQKNHASWCAVNKADNLLYSSTFDASVIFAYEYTIRNNSFSLRLNHKLNLKNGNGSKFKLKGIQGGVFANLSGNTILFLSSNDDSTRGVNAFEVSTGKRIDYKKIDSDFFTVGEEIEGLTFWDLDNNKAPKIKGQIHVIELDNDIDSDDIKSFYHFRVFESKFVANKNPNKMEVHRFDCTWVNFISFKHRVPYNNLRKALNDGFDGCFYCLKEFNTR